jgi:hypothetical protein
VAGNVGSSLLSHALTAIDRPYAVRRTYSPTACGKGCFVGYAFRHVIPSAKGPAVRTTECIRHDCEEGPPALGLS